MDASAEQQPPVWAKRFWAKVLKLEGECWEWQGWKRYGYGVFYIQHKKYLAHRLSYKLIKGEIPTGLYVCHTCDNPSCINPAHLFAGTQQQNVSDMIKKGRMKFRARKTHCKRGHELIDENVLIIKGVASRQCRLCAIHRAREISVMIPHKIRQSKQYCKRGHELVEGNLVSGRGRKCLTCHNERCRIARRKKT